MTKFRMTIAVHAESETEAKAYYEATKKLGLGGKMSVSSSEDSEYWTVDISSDLEGVGLDELRKRIDFLESIEAAL